MSETAECLYRHKKTNQVVRVTGHRKAVLAGRFTAVYQVVWPDGTREDVQSSTFHKQFVKEEPDGR